MNAQRCRELQRACTLFDHIKHRGPVSARRGPRSAQFGDHRRSPQLNGGIPFLDSARYRS